MENLATGPDFPAIPARRTMRGQDVVYHNLANIRTGTEQPPSIDPASAQDHDGCYSLAGELSMISAEKRLSVAVLLGSVRRDRMGIRAARLVVRTLELRGHEAVLVDPMELQLPLLDRMYKEHPAGKAPATLEQLATLYRRVDGFLIVSGEYNHGIPPALKNLLDHFLEEYFWRPSGIVCYSAGRFGGVRAAVALRSTLAELGMPSISSECAIASIGKVLDENGNVLDEHVSTTLGRFLDEFGWYARALKRERELGTPY